MKNNSTMKNLSKFNLLIIILLFSSCRQQPFTGTVHIIPYPNQIAIGTQYRPIGKNLSIYLSPESGMDKDYIEDLLSDTGVKCKFTNFKWIADLTFDIKPDTIGLEGYRLVSNDYGTKITASDTKGLFYGLQTFRQLITSQNNTLVIPFVEIADSPKFLWRALMLDEGRYFKGKEEVKKLLDEMARLKMNTFHWHLTDDQGWRIEIKKYPLLTKIGGKRDSTQIGNWNSNIYDGKVHEGFYTQEEIKEIKSIVNRTLQNMPPQRRTIYQMSREQFLSNDEIAKTLGLSKRTVEKHISLALATIKKNLGDFLFWLFIFFIK